MADDFTTDPPVEPYFRVTDLMCGLIFCAACNREPVYPSDAPEMSDQRRYDQAVAMWREQWELLPDGVSVLCPDCASA